MMMMNKHISNKTRYEVGDRMTILTTSEAVTIIGGGILLSIFSFAMGRMSKRKKDS